MEAWITSAYQGFTGFVIGWLPWIIFGAVAFFNWQDGNDAGEKLQNTVDDIIAGLLFLAMLHDKFQAIAVDPPLGAPPILLFTIWVIYKFFEFRRGKASIIEMLMDDAIKGPALAMAWIIYKLS